MKKLINLFVFIFLIQNIYSDDLIYGLSQDQILSGDFNSVTFQNLISNPTYSTLLTKDSFYFQILTIESGELKTEQKANKNIVSILEINAECIQSIQEELQSENLYILKFDSNPFVQNSSEINFIICSSSGKNCINNPLCKDNPIKITFKYDLEESKKTLLKTLNEWRNIDLFNIFDPFFQDICFRYTSKEGTDVLLDDRIANYYISNDFCSDSKNIYTYDSFEFVNEEDLYLYVSCSVGEFTNENQKQEMLDVIDDKMNIVLKNSNFKVAKCWDLVLNYKNIHGCYTSIIMMAIFFCHLFSFIIYLCVGTTPIKKDIEKFLQEDIQDNDTEKSLNKNEQKNEKIEELNSNNNKSKENKLDNNEKKEEDKCNEYEDVQEVEVINITNPSNPPKNENNNVKKYVSNKNRNINSSKFVTNNTSGKKLNKILNKIEKDENEHKRLFKYNDDELNLLDYKHALKYDKRCCCAYYYSILKYSNLILFTFVVGDDYNLRIVKICLFIFSFAMYLTFNCLLFNNSSMRKIYENNGVLGLLDSLPRIIASSLISTIILFFLKKLCLGKNGVREIRNESKIENVRESIKSFLCCLKCRIWIYFNFSLIFLIVFWYFVSAFCIIYSNTQWIIIKDTLISFAIGFIYPFFLCFIPTIFRNCGLCCKCECCYCCSKICQLF
jgi:hypothetical protein